MPLSDRITSDLVVRDGLPPGVPQGGRVSKIPAGPWKKTVEVVKKILIFTLVTVGTVLGNILTLGIPTILAHFSDAKRTDMKKAVETQQIEHIYTALCCGLKGDAKWKLQTAEVRMDETSLLGEITNPSKDAKYFVRLVLQLRQAVSRLDSSRREGNVTLGSVEAVYAKFQNLAEDARFMTVFNDLSSTDNSAVNFLKLLAAKFRSADMSALLIQHAKEKLGEIQPATTDGYTIGQTGKALVGYRKKPSFKHNVFWAISHPSAWYHSCESQYLHKKYDSHEDNPTYSVQEIEFTTKKNKKLTTRFIAGPTPFNDPVYHNIFLKDAHELRFNIMDTAKPNEHAWIKKMDAAAHSSQGHLEHVAWGFATKEKRGYLEHTTLDPLLEGYQNALLKGDACRVVNDRKTDNGVIIPDTLLNDPQIKSAFTHTKALMNDLKPDLTKEASRHAVLVAADTMMAIGTMVNYLDNLQDIIEDETIDADMRAIHIATACKQCFDRGPVYFAALMIFFRSLDPLTGAQPLNEDEFYRIAGLPLFRAPLNEGREQLNGKFKVYMELAKMLGPNMATLAKHTRAFRASL